MKKPNIADIEFVIMADAPTDVVTMLISELRRRQDGASARLPGITGIKARAKVEAEVRTYDGILWMLSRLKIEGPLVDRCLKPPRWGFEADFEHAVRVLAGTHTTAEVPGTERDTSVDACITACRYLMHREEDALRIIEEHERSKAS